MGIDYPPTPLYILLAVTFTGISIAVTIQRGLKANERRSKSNQAMRFVGSWTLVLSWLHVAGLVLMQLTVAILLCRWEELTNSLVHFLVLVLLGLFAYRLIQAISQPEETQQETGSTNVLLN